MSDSRQVRVFKCPCKGNNYILAGEPNKNPDLKEKREIGEYVAMGCTVLLMSIDKFRKENWQYCGNHS